MRPRKRRRFAKICSFLIAASVSFSPLAHAILMSSLVETANVETSFNLQTEQPCHHHGSIDSKNPAMSAICKIAGGDSASHCDQPGAGSICKVLCSVSTAMPFPSDNLLSVRTNSDWSDYYSDLNLTPISVPLYKPPRL